MPTPTPVGGSTASLTLAAATAKNHPHRSASHVERWRSPQSRSLHSRGRRADLDSVEPILCVEAIRRLQRRLNVGARRQPGFVNRRSVNRRLGVNRLTG
jgi:hypothetical protein